MKKLETLIEHMMFTTFFLMVGAGYNVWLGRDTIATGIGELVVIGGFTTACLMAIQLYRLNTRPGR